MTAVAPSVVLIEDFPDRVLWRLNRPQVRNAIDRDMDVRFMTHALLSRPIRASS